MKKVLMLLSNPFSPDPRVYKEASSLEKAGYKVKILCWDRELKYKQKENLEGILIERIKLRAGYGFKNLLIKLPLFWIKLFFKALKEDYDILHCHDYDTLIVGTILKSFKRKKLIYDSHELFLDYTENKIINKLIFFIEKICFPKIDLLIYTNEERLKILIQNLPSKIKNSIRHKTIIIHNYPPIQNNFKKEWKNIVIQLSGALKESKNVLNIINAFDRITKIDKNFELIIIGNFSTKYGQKIRNYLRYKNIDKIKLKNSIQFKDFIKFLKRTNIVLIPIAQNNLNNVFPEPNKLFEAFATKNFVIAEKNDYIKRIVKENGLYCDFSKEEDIFNKFVFISKNKKLIKKKVEKMYEEHIKKYNWKKEEEKLLKAYERLLL
ncbi:MAG: glycosyltransferase [Candidatus Woesearchaeota archaeon]